MYACSSKMLKSSYCYGNECFHVLSSWKFWFLHTFIFNELKRSWFGCIVIYNEFLKFIVSSFFALFFKKLRKNWSDHWRLLVIKRCTLLVYMYAFITYTRITSIKINESISKVFICICCYDTQFYWLSLFLYILLL